MRAVEAKRFCGSFTLEAAWIMAMVFVSISVIMGQAGRIHDETAGAMVLHEAVEKGRHEKTEEPKTVVEVCQEYLGLLLSFPSFHISLDEEGGAYQGRGAGGSWEKTIQAEAFRPERFLRRITLLEGLGENNGD